MAASFITNVIVSFLDSYEDLLAAATFLIHTQILAGLLGSLSPLSSSLSSLHATAGMFALVAFASGYQGLGRTYSALLGGLMIADVAWFVIYLHDSGRSLLPSSPYASAALSLTFYMQCVNLAACAMSACILARMYQLGLPTADDPLFSRADGPFSYSLPRSFSLDFEQQSPTLHGGGGGATPDSLSGGALTAGLLLPSSRFRSSNPPSDDFLGSSVFSPSSFTSALQGGNQQFGSSFRAASEEEGGRSWNSHSSGSNSSKGGAAGGGMGINRAEEGTEVEANDQEAAVEDLGDEERKVNRNIV